jgi:DNA-binding Lrp family transcriptional regulator
LRNNGSFRSKSRSLKRSTNRNSILEGSQKISVDRTDLEVLKRMTSGFSAKRISEEIGMPLSTVQRRVKQLLLNEIAILKYDVNYRKLGFKKGLLHMSLKDGKIDSLVTKLSGMNGFLSASVQLGNSDILASFAFKEPQEVLELLTNTRSIDGVGSVFWSEEVYSVSKEHEFIQNHY